MISPASYRLLADAVLLLHLAVVCFVIGGLLAVLLGWSRGWQWIRRPGFRLMHLTAIGTVVAQAWLGQACPLTVLEDWLQLSAGEAGYRAGFIQHWVGRLLYYDAPSWQFTALYSVFGLLVLAAWWWLPPQRRAEPKAHGSP